MYLVEGGLPRDKGPAAHIIHGACPRHGLHMMKVHGIRSHVHTNTVAGIMGSHLHDARRRRPTSRRAVRPNCTWKPGDVSSVLMSGQVSSRSCAWSGAATAAAAAAPEPLELAALLLRPSFLCALQPAYAGCVQTLRQCKANSINQYAKRGMLPADKSHCFQPSCSLLGGRR